MKGQNSKNLCANIKYLIIRLKSMALHFDIRLGIVLFLALTISGISLFSYSTQESYPVQSTQLIPQQQSSVVTVLTQNINQIITAHTTPLTYTWDGSAQPYSSIDFNIYQTSQPISVLITDETLWNNNPNNYNPILYDTSQSSNDVGSHKVGVPTGDTCELQIFIHSSNSVTVQGTITLTKTVTSTQEVPYPNTTYETETVHPDQSIGEILIVFGIIAGIVTAISFLANRNRMKF